MSSQNPFQPAPGASPPELVGRAAELSSILDATERAKSGSVPTPIVFMGLRGIGKTVLLNRLIESAGPKAAVLRLEVESDVPLATVVQDGIARLLPALESAPKRFLSALDAALRQLPKLEYGLPHEMGSFSLEPPAEETPRLMPLRAALLALNDAVSGTGRFLVMTIDEIHDVDIASLRTVSAVAHQSAGTRAPILLACAGLPHTVQIVQKLRTYAHRWEQYELDLLRRAEVVQAIRMPIERAGDHIDTAALDLLAERSAGYPFFVQKYASAAWNAHHGGRITMADVERILPGVQASIDKTFYRDALENLSPRERMFVIALSELGPGSHELRAVSSRLGVGSMALGSIRTQLIKKNVVFSPRSGAIQFRIPLAERYIADHRDDYETADVIAYRAQFHRGEHA
jgi:hypothetical protein